MRQGCFVRVGAGPCHHDCIHVLGSCDRVLLLVVVVDGLHRRAPVGVDSLDGSPYSELALFVDSGLTLWRWSGLICGLGDVQVPGSPATGLRRKSRSLSCAPAGTGSARSKLKKTNTMCFMAASSLVPSVVEGGGHILAQRHALLSCGALTVIGPVRRPVTLSRSNSEDLSVTRGLARGRVPGESRPSVVRPTHGPWAAACHPAHSRR